MAGYLVFVRFFIDYSKDFPFDRFANLSDAEVGLAIRKWDLARQKTTAYRRALEKHVNRSPRNWLPWYGFFCGANRRTNSCGPAPGTGALPRW